MRDLNATLQFITSFLAFGCVFTACKKSESDYLGQYETFTCQSVQIADDFSTLSFYSGRDHGRSAKSYYVLNSIKLTLFKDETEKTLKGEGTADFISINNLSTRPSAKKQDISFDLKNLRIDNDTLKFQLTNRSLEGQNKTIRGQLYNDANNSVLGLDKELSGINEYTAKSPFYLKEAGEMVYYKISSDKSAEQLRSFYQTQVQEYQKRIQSAEAKKLEKEILANSVNAIKAGYLKD